MVYTTIQLVARSFRLNVQFRGSSGSSLGCGTRRTSFCPFPSACLEDSCPDVSMSRTVPGGKTSGDMMSGFSDTIVLMDGDGDEVTRDGPRWSVPVNFGLEPIYVSSRPVSYCDPTLDRQAVQRYDDKLCPCDCRMLPCSISIAFQDVQTNIVSTTADI